MEHYDPTQRGRRDIMGGSESYFPPRCWMFLACGYCGGVRDVRGMEAYDGDPGRCSTGVNMVTLSDSEAAKQHSTRMGGSAHFPPGGWRMDGCGCSQH
jgi:hypothetical protein